MTVVVGSYYKTPWEPSGVVRVREIEPGRGTLSETAFIEFVGDHPRGYKDGTFGRYYTKELEGREVIYPAASRY